LGFWKRAGLCVLLALPASILGTWLLDLFGIPQNTPIGKVVWFTFPLLIWFWFWESWGDQAADQL